MNVPSLEFCASAVLRRFLIENGTMKDGRTAIINQILAMRTFDRCLEELLSAIVDENPTAMNDDLLVLLLSGSIHMKSLVLKNCVNVTIDGLTSALKCQPYIQHIDMSGCNQLAKPSIGKVFGETLNGLESIILESCDQLNDETLKDIIVNSPQLIYISVASCLSLTDDAFNFDSISTDLDKKSEILGSLKWIDLSGCQSISSTTLRHLCSLCGQRLERVNLSWTNIDCTALICLSGYCLASAVYVATAGNENMPFSVAELEASQDYEFQMAHNAGANDGTTEAEPASTATEASISHLYKPQQIFVSHISALDISEIAFFDFEVGIVCLEMFVKANHCLKTLNISWRDLPDSALEMIAKNEPELTKIGLVDCDSLSNFGIMALGEHCKKLTNLDLQGVPFVSDAGLINVLLNGELTNLSLAECAITDVTLRRITKHCSSTIRNLNFSWCDEITDTGLSELVYSCPDLQSLNLRQCETSIKTIEVLKDNGRNLTFLSLYSITDLTDSLAMQLLQNLKQLKYIDLSWNSMLTDETMSVLMVSCSMLREAILAGLKRITSKAFVPIIAGLNAWRDRRSAIRFRLLKKKDEGVVMTTRNLVAQEVLDTAFYLPYRSLHYAANLRKINFSYSDQVSDIHLGEIVTVCRGTLEINDYYSLPVKPIYDI
eukprot:Seg611.7 transcript_id=Seg611.7/GoldUCD/mRNA.D3Y31 product="SCF E3 ubiquitin ligase complex F-box protein grrA" protein_id=Seg611.7/GoldUCD/D3Y31